MGNPQFNRMLVSYLDQEDGGLKKFAAAGRAFVRDHLREECNCDRIIPPERLDPTEQRVIPAKDNDTLVVRKDLEPQSKAFALTFGSQPDARIVDSRRIDVPLFTISSEMFQIYEEHLYAYEMEITKLIEQNTVKDIGTIKDLEFLTYSQASVTATGRRVLGAQATADRAAAGGAATGDRFEIERPDFVDLYKVMLASGNKKRLKRIWMNDEDWSDILKWTTEDAGSPMQSETFKDGYTYDTVLGYLVIRTIQSDLLKTGNIYGYTEPEFLGFHFVLNDIKFYIDKVANLIRWQAWTNCGLSFSNISSVAKTELYNGRAAGDASSDTLPTQRDLFQQTNPAFSGGAYYPQVNLG